MNPDEIKTLVDGLSSAAPPFYQTLEFYISNIIGVAGVIFSILAFIEAKKAKLAAAQAGTTVKIQTITIELTEIAQRLDKLDYNLDFTTARDLLNEVNRRLRRLIAPFQENTQFQGPSQALKSALDDAKKALDEVRPTTMEAPTAENIVYFGMQGHFSSISAHVAEMMGLFEAQNIEKIHEPSTRRTN